MRMNWIRVATAIVVALLLTFAAPVGFSQDAGEILDVSLKHAKSGSPGMALRLRYCPKGTIVPGRPAKGDEGGSPSPVDVAAFYLGETEVTLEQIRMVVPEAMTRIQELAAKTAGQPELAAMASQMGNEPAFYVTLRDAIDFCRTLTDRADQERNAKELPSVEQRLFRLPSHVEWQYAARAIADADKRGERPHFIRWIKLSQLSAANQRKCDEIWEELGLGAKCPDTEEAFLELSRAASASSEEKLRDILTEAFGKAYRSPPRLPAGVGRLRPVAQTLPNAWHLHDLEDGVAEYALWARDQTRARTMWQRLIDRRASSDSLERVEDLFLCGGSFGDSYFRAGALQRFTIWGGPQMTDGQPAPITVTSETILDHTPGFRVLMERTLAADWTRLVRKAAIRGGRILPPGARYLAENEATISRITDAGHPARTAVRFYRELIAARQSHRPISPEIVSDVSALAAKGTKESSVANRLRNALASSAAGEKKKVSPLTGDAAFFQLTGELLAD